MKTKKTIFASVLTGIALATLGTRSVQAVIVMDQIGTNGAVFTNPQNTTPGVLSNNRFVSQRFEATNASFNAAVVDDFQVGSAFTLTNVTAAIQGWNGFTSYSNITGYEVNIYSSLAAAGQNINGDVFHMTLSPAQVSLSPFAGDLDTNSELVSLPINALLSKGGTYYVSVLGDLAFSNGEIGVYSSNAVLGATPGGSNAYLTNPGGSFNLSPNPQGLGSNAAYRLSGTTTVPDTGTTVVLLGMAVASLALLRRKLLA